jgi:hypothetical protein
MRVRVLASGTAGVLATGLLVSLAASAHHGFGTFAMNEDIELSGVVTSMDFVNPQSWLNFEVTRAYGTVADYR